MKIKKIAIVGMGALGLMYGQHIQEACGKEALFFVMDEARHQRHKNDVYLINGQQQAFTMVSSREATPVDLVIVATKYSGLTEALEEMTNLVGPKTAIISVLNGITSEELIAQRFGDKNLLHCVVLGMDAVREGTSLTFHHKGLVKVGKVKEEQQEALAAVVEFFDKIALPYVVEEDILQALWAKLLLNVGINQTCMVYETSYGGALAKAEARESMFAAMHEVIAVAQCEGVKLTEADFEAAVKVISGLTYEGLPSMRQDALARRKSEVDLFAGTIIALGKKHGVPVPVNEHYYKIIKEIEAQY